MWINRADEPYLRLKLDSVSGTLRLIWIQGTLLSSTIQWSELRASRAVRRCRRRFLAAVSAGLIGSASAATLWRGIQMGCDFLALARQRRKLVSASLPPENRPVVSGISLWEFATLVEIGRVEIEGSVTDWLRIAASPATVKIQSITPAIVAEMNRLPAKFHRDPADRLIVATARFLKLPLATKDRKIRHSRLVSIWKP